MDGLMTENTALRRRWLNKTDEFCRYQSGIEKSQAQTIRRFKDTVSEDQLPICTCAYNTPCFYTICHHKLIVHDHIGKICLHVQNLGGGGGGSLCTRIGREWRKEGEQKRERAG